MLTIEVPDMWTFHKGCCGAMYGAVVADQTFGGKYPDGSILATEAQAWDDFYEGRKRDGNAARKRGDYVKAADDTGGLGSPHADDCPTRELDKETRQ